MLERYDLSSPDKAYEALREILQEIVLYGLSRAGFFDHAVFYGGTALRILYGLDRFSEDLDFSLLSADKDFDLSSYQNPLIEALRSFGFDVTIQIKNDTSDIKSAFVKGNTAQHLLNISAPSDIVQIFGQGKLVKIKFEVDTNPPLEFSTERKTLLIPAPFIINTMTIPSLFAGKMHAILCRNWSTRPKGRDWYDLVWYISHRYPLDIKHLNARLLQDCPWAKEQNIKMKNEIDKAYIIELLTKRIKALDVQMAKKDIEPFVADSSVLDIWSQEFFMKIIGQIEFIVGEKTL